MSGALKGVTVNALAALVAYTIRTEHDYDPDHGGPEDQAEDYAWAVVDAALTLLATLDPRVLIRGGGDLPRALVLSVSFDKGGA